jgi:hypothetical protein
MYPALEIELRNNHHRLNLKTFYHQFSLYQVKIKSWTIKLTKYCNKSHNINSS